MRSGPLDELSALCLACGACCDGTLFTHAELDADESARLGARLRMLPLSSERPAFAQPCSAHDGAGCTLYEQRPSVCSRYRCELYKACEAKTAKVDASIALVRRIKVLAARVREKLGSDDTPRSLWQRVATLGSTTSAELAARDPDLAMDIAELALRVKRDLGVAPDGKLPGSSP